MILTLKHIVLNTVPDGYDSSPGGALDQFTEKLNGNFDGDLAHLVTLKANGGVAYLDVLCAGYWRTGYSALMGSYNNVPYYSWTVEVIAHELGHNVASPHTHACSWGPNGNECIDRCGKDAGYDGCWGNDVCNGPLPDDGGTIMSYCHLLGGVGINFNKGFGQEVTDLMQSRINNASCLSTCGSSCVTYYQDADADGFGDPYVS